MLGIWEEQRSQVIKRLTSLLLLSKPHVHSSHPGMLPEPLRRLQCESSTSPAQIIYNGNLYDVKSVTALHGCCISRLVWPAGLFLVFPLSAILNEWDQLNQTCQMYWGCFDPTGKHLQVYLAPWEFYILAIYIPHTTHAAHYAPGVKPRSPLGTDMRMPWALSSSLLLVALTNIPSLSRKVPGLPSLLCLIPIRPFQPTA